MARNNVSTTVHVGMDVQLAKRNAEALKEVIATLRKELKEQRAIMEAPPNNDAWEKASQAVDKLILKIRTLEKVQRSATPAAAYESYISGDAMNSNTLRQAQRGAKNRLNTVRTDEGDTVARQFINDSNDIQKQLNRLQAGFTSPFKTIKYELNKLSGGELQRLHDLLMQEQKLVQGNDKAWANYAVAIGKVDERMREYDTLARQTAGADTLAKAQNGGFAKANERDIQRAIEKLKEYKAVINDPNGTGKATYEATNTEIKKLQDNLDALKRKEQEASGQSMSLANALRTGMESLNGTFKGTTQQLNLAKKALEANLLTATRGSAEYNNIKRALNGVELELQKTGQLSQEIRAVLDKPQGKSFNELKQAVEQGRIALQSMRTETDKDKKAFDDLAAKIKVADQQMKTLAGSAKGTATAFDKAWSRLKTYIGLYMGAAVAIQKLVGTLSDLGELSDKMGEVRKTTGFTADEVGRLSENLKKMDVRTPLTQLMEVAAAAGQLGLKSEKDVLGFAEAANKLMIALPEMGKEAATEMMRVAIATGEVDKIGKQMEEGLIEGTSKTAVAMEKIASTIDRLRATSASTAPEITDFVKRVGAVGAQSGITIDQVSALGSTISSLGLRIEMSATALSRMIPAIKNNAFDIARAIGVTPDTIRNLFETGRGMEAILMILQHMKDTGMDEDSIEAMMGMGGMRDIMKDLNQQGARAGIVFAGLSQNVDELRRQLIVANQAYEENVAIQQEFDKMNQTTAARWERLKNQIEEMFVGDQAQRFLGDIIDGLRTIVDFIASDGPIAKGLKYIMVLWAAFRLGIGQALFANMPNMLGSLTASIGRFFSVTLMGLGNMAASMGIVTARTRLARMEWAKLEVAMKQNIFGLVATVIVVAIYKLIQWTQKVAEARKEIGEMAQEMVKAEQTVKDNFKTVDKANVTLNEATKKLKEAQAALEKARKAMDGTKESADRLAKAEENVKKAEDEVKIAKDGHRAAIENLNKIYGSYLGFILSEISSNKELANAQELVNTKLRESIILRRKEAAINRVEGENGEDRDKSYGKLSEQVRSLMLGSTTIKTKGKDGKVTSKEVKVANTKENERLLKEITKLAQTEEFATLQVTEQQKRIKKLLAGTQYENYTAIIGRLTAQASDYAKEYQDVNKKVKDVAAQFDAQADVEREESQEKLKKQYTEAGKTYANLQSQYNKATGDVKKKAAANLLKQADSLQGMISAAPNYYDLTNADEKAAYDKFVKDSQARLDGINEQRDKLLKEAGSYYNPSSITGGGGGGYNPWGQKQGAESTAYTEMNAEQLVERRKQMKNFVNAIQTDSDVQSVLKEDKALQKAIEKGMSSDMRTVIEWYNTERLKIQDELHARHLTNTGDWMDPKKQKNRHKQFKAEMTAYLEELDAYYTERNQKIQEARNNEDITEGEAWRQTIENESEWHQRRAELQKMYSDKAVEVAKTEQDAIHNIIAERTGDDATFIEKSIEKTKKFAEMVRKADERGEAEFRKWMADLGLGWERDYLKQEKAIGKQVKFMADTLAKERPLNGITEDLELNLTKMGVLVGNIPDKMHFLLGQIEDAFSLDAKSLTDRIVKEGKEGFKEWADMINGDVSVQQALLGQLRQAYEKVQDAIRKEGSRIKKDADMMWKLALTPDGKNLKQETDAALARLGLVQDSMGRANSLIGAGSASDNVVSKLAIKQLQLQLSIQRAQFALMRKMGDEKAQYLDQLAEQYRLQGKIKEAERATMDAENVRKSLSLAITEEKKKQADLTNQIAKEQEEMQNRMYKDLKEWGDLFVSSLQSVFEASHAGDAEYYNELAKMRLTGSGGPGAGRYMIIDNAGTEGATAHYEYLDERAALERQRDIERQNAQAEAWKKVWDDINNKIAESLTDWVNAWLQNQSIDLNTAALNLDIEATKLNTQAVQGLTSQLAQGIKINGGDGSSKEGAPADNGFAADKQTYYESLTDSDSIETTPQTFESTGDFATDKMMAQAAMSGLDPMSAVQPQIDADNLLTQTKLDNQQKIKHGQESTDQQIARSNQSTIAKMIAATNLYGAAYQAMSNDNLDMAQKFQMIALQAVGNVAMVGLEVAMKEAFGKTAVNQAVALSKDNAENGSILGPILWAIGSALVGGLMGIASSKIASSKSQIASMTGASMGAGRLSTGMLTYAEGNVNEMTDPKSLTPGRHYNVDGADGRTYRAKYMGKDAKTHITTGAEFHLVGEKGREAIIDAHTTRNIQMNDPEIWRTIQTLYNGGSMSRIRSRRGRGVHAFAEGNLDDFEEIGSETGVDTGMSMEQIVSLQASIDRQSDLLEYLRVNGIKATFDVYGKGGLIDSYDSGKKNVTRHGERY